MILKGLFYFRRRPGHCAPVAKQEILQGDDRNPEDGNG
jgi:hypothetical protein